MRNLKTPRTLNEALGPYTSRDFSEDRKLTPIQMAFAVVYAASIITLILVLA